MMKTAKHFPGHGYVIPDSHASLPIDDRTMASLQPDLTPFRYAIKQGVEIIMTAHITYDKIDPLPASFSPWWIKVFLREQLGYRGFVVSDDFRNGRRRNYRLY